MAFPVRLPSGLAVLALAATGSLGLGAGPASAAIDAERVSGLCLAGFNAAMVAARKTPPAGMGEFTCKCFVDQINTGASIDQARDTCRTQAATRFNMK